MSLCWFWGATLGVLVLRFSEREVTACPYERCLDLAEPVGVVCWHLWQHRIISHHLLWLVWRKLSRVPLPHFLSRYLMACPLSPLWQVRAGAVEEWPGRRERATSTWLLTFQVFKLNFKTYNENVMNQLSLSHKGGRFNFFFFFCTTLFLWLEWYIPANLTFVWNRSTESKKVRASRILA